MVERLHPDQIGGVDAADIAAFIESDFKIRSGLCPNDCGLMQENSYGQECSTCGFSCNTLPERPPHDH